MGPRWRELLVRAGVPALWIAGTVAAFVVTLLAQKRPDLQAPAVAATGVILLWYTVETRGLRLEQVRSRKQQDAENELRSHPWLRATGLKPDWKANEGPGLLGRWVVYLPITNVGASPAFDVRTRVEWKTTSDVPQSGEATFREVALAPGDSANLRLCEVDLYTPQDRASVGVEITYRNHVGGGGRLRLSFLQDEAGKGWENGPMSYEFRLSDGRTYPALVEEPRHSQRNGEAGAKPGRRWSPRWLRTFLQVAALALTVEAAIFLAVGNLGLTPQVIAELSTTKATYNPDVAGSLAEQAIGTWVGVVLLVAGFLFQLVNQVWPMRFQDFEVSRPGVVAAVAFSAVVFAVAYWASDVLSHRTENEVMRLLSELPQ